MQRGISNRNTLVDTLNPIDDARRSTAIDRMTSNYNDFFFLLRFISQTQYKLTNISIQI